MALALCGSVGMASSFVRSRCACALAHHHRALSSGPSPDDVYDVAIVGGGMVGAAVAALLGANRLTSQLRVAVLDVRPQPTTFSPRPVPDLRVSTVTPGSIEVLRAAGAWEQVAAGSASFSSMQVWDSATPGHIRWDARDTGAERMGVVAENTLLQAALLAAAQRSGSRTEFMWPAEVKALRLPPDEQAATTSSSSSPPSPSSPAPSASASSASSSAPAGASSGGDGRGASTAGGGGGGDGQGPRRHGLAELELADGRVLTCRLVVAADGAASRIRQMAGLRTWGWGYGQRGLVATVTTAEPSDTAWQRFLPTGPLALLPARDGFSNIVWSTTPDAAAALEAMAPHEFAAAVNRVLRDPATAPQLPGASLLGPLGAALGAALGGSSAAGGGALQEPPLVLGWAGGPPRSFPLQLKQAGRYVLPRLALVGDAAHAVHPLAGQGVNLGFGDARALAAALAAAVEGGTDSGDGRLLVEAYEAPRRRAVLTMVAALDGVKKMFEVQSPPLASLRGLGLGLINSVGPVRNGIMQYAMLGEV